MHSSYRTTRSSGNAFDLYVAGLIILWLSLFPIFIFAAQPKELFLDWLKKLEQRSHKCVTLEGNM
jgi:hypothetical protein